MSNLPDQDSVARVGRPFPWPLAIVATLTALLSLAVIYGVAVTMEFTTADDPCDLDLRLHDRAATVGSRSVEVRDKALVGARLIRFQPNSEEYASVYACRPNGTLLEPTEVFELTPHLDSAESLAAQFLWVFKERRGARLEIVTSEDAFAALPVPRDAFAAPALRSGVVTFWHVDWMPGSAAPRSYQVVIDARTGLGGESRGSAADPPWSRAFMVESLLAGGSQRELAFHLLAAGPQSELSSELLTALESAQESENPYLGLLGTRGMPFPDNGERLAKLAAGPAAKEVRMGVVQALATLVGPRPRELATSILQHESDPRARRIMIAALSDQAPR